MPNLSSEGRIEDFDPPTRMESVSGMSRRFEHRSGLSPQVESDYRHISAKITRLHIVMTPVLQFPPPNLIYSQIYSPFESYTDSCITLARGELRKNLSVAPVLGLADTVCVWGCQTHKEIGNVPRKVGIGGAVSVWYNG